MNNKRDKVNTFRYCISAVIHLTVILKLSP